MFTVFRAEIKDRAKEFAKEIPKNTTISVLQKFFVDKRKSEDIFKDIDYIKEIQSIHNVGESESARGMVM